MSGKLQKQVNPKVAALLILLVLIAVQWAWWRGLIYRPPGQPPGPMAGGPMPSGGDVSISGRDDVEVETYAGDLEPGDTDGPGYSARFDRPTGLALDRQGNLYVADTGNHRIRMIAPGGITSTIAGGEQGYADGPATQARFNAPCGVAVGPDGGVYVADTGNGCVRRIQNGQVTTIIGKPPAAGNATPPVLLPTSLVCVAGAQPSLLVADARTKSVRKYRLDGAPLGEQRVAGPPTTVAGAGVTAVAIPQSGTIQLGANALKYVHIAGAEAPPNRKPDPFTLRQPVGLWPMGGGWLVTADDHAAVFLYRNGQAELLAGRSSSARAERGFRDGDGEHALLGNLTAIVADGKKYAYVADTANNAIRRLTLPEDVGG